MTDLTLFDLESTGIPAAADRLARTARAAGWLVSVRVARGTLPGATVHAWREAEGRTPTGRPRRVREDTGEPAPAVELAAVLMRRGSVRLAALWYDGAYSSTVSAGLRRYNAAETRTLIYSPASSTPASSTPASSTPASSTPASSGPADLDTARAVAVLASSGMLPALPAAAGVAA
jgi:hypothetical protein